MSWTVSQINANLPAGFSATEDGTFLYLHHLGGIVKTFYSKGKVTPDSVKEAAEKYFKDHVRVNKR